MNKLSALLKTPKGVVIAVGAIVLIGELLIMLLFGSVHNAFLSDVAHEAIAFEYIDPVLLILLVSPALYILIFRPMRTQQAMLERQLDELQSFHALSVGRELRMKELVEEIAALHNQFPSETVTDIPFASPSHDVPPDAAEQHATLQPSEEDQRHALLSMLRDLETGRRKIKQAHQEWMDALDVVEDPIFLHDKEFRILRCNKAYQQRAGMPFKQIIGQLYYKVFPKADTPLSSCLKAMGKRDEEDEEVRVGDATYRSRSFSVHDKQGAHLYSVHILEDITERKKSEIEIRHANRALATLSAVNHTLVHASGENELLQTICKAIVEKHVYRLAWVGYAQHDENNSIRIMASAGHDEGFLNVMQHIWTETRSGTGPCGNAIRSGATQLCQDIAKDPQCEPWREEALKRDLASSIWLPLVNENNTMFGLLTVYAKEVNAFSSNEVELLEEMAADLAFGVRTLHTRNERDLALEKIQLQFRQLRDSLEDTVRAIATIVEMRDPYTAGHQSRVADLAVAIARQMKLPDEQVHTIHLAGLVHDLGKIQVPAEILSKPGKFTGIEFSLIKIHPRAGYEILKGIDFPWPIADMVLQHHERMDGSGYPQGLKGDAILLEARIICVADVVEAMSSHRPYRPGLGLEVALEEITRNRDRFYDPQVVNACLTLFRDQHYVFKS